jgi:3'-phosphoadenosine 5'-phosphosulfate sulfotransferase (PAPS reductase)/FAD synthetase
MGLWACIGKKKVLADSSYSGLWLNPSWHLFQQNKTLQIHPVSTHHAVKVVFIDTLHLFEETVTFLHDNEQRYDFKALYYTPKEFKTFAEYSAVHGVDLPIRDIEECAP